MRSICRHIQLQATNVVGLSEEAKAKRKHRNVVTMKYNLLNYILESVSVVLMITVDDYFIDILYVTINCCGTPLVYFLGIEENREHAQEYFRSHVKFFRKSQVQRETISTEAVSPISCRTSTESAVHNFNYGVTEQHEVLNDTFAHKNLHFILPGTVENHL